MPGAFGQNGGSIKLVNDSYVLGLWPRAVRGNRAASACMAPSQRSVDGPRVRHRALGRVSSRWSPFPPIQTVTSKLSLTTVTRYNINALYLEEPEDPPRAREAAHANHDAGGSGGRRRPRLPRMQQRAPRACLDAPRASPRLLRPRAHQSRHRGPPP